MNAIVFEQVPVAELPLAWREKLSGMAQQPRQQVPVRIEAEDTPGSTQGAQGQAAPEFANDPLFGMWRDREDMVDVAAYVRCIREPRSPHTAPKLSALRV